MLTPNEGESSFLTGEGGAGCSRRATPGLWREDRRGDPRAAGARWSTLARVELSVAGFPVTAIDSTAAGDAFNGFLAVSLAEGLDLTQAVPRACAAGALATTVPGARPSLPFRESVDDLWGRNRVEASRSGQSSQKPSS